MNKEILAKEWLGYTIIKSIHFETDFKSESKECSLFLSLAKELSEVDNCINILFSGVSNLKIGEISGGLSQICRLDVANISERQWDRLHYYVFDYENNAISFNCRDIEYIS